MTTDVKQCVGSEGEAVDLGRLVARALGDGPASVRGAGVRILDVCDDSRRVVPGSLFVAVTGTRTRGAAHVGDAAARGAAAVVVTDTEVALDPGVLGRAGPIVIEVPDARQALARLAAVFCGLDRIQAAGELNVTGVTGTNGKTTVAYLMRSLLRAAGRRVAMLGTIEYDLLGRRVRADLTTPGPMALTRYLVEAQGAGARHAVIEASSHSLEQRRTDGVLFSTAIFTNLTQDHLDYHGTPEAYFRAKRRLFEGLSPQAIAVVNASETVCEPLVDNCPARVIRYCMEPHAGHRAARGNEPIDVRGRILDDAPLPGRREAEGGGGSGYGGGVSIEIAYQGACVEVRTQLVGGHNGVNALAAAAAGLAMGLDMGTIRRGLEALACVPGRLHRVDTGRLGFDVFVDYAHTDDALRHVLRAVRPLTRGRLWCVFGCGGDRDPTKRPLMARAVAEGANVFIITNDNPRTEDPEAIIADIERGLDGDDRDRARTVPDRAEAIAQAISELSPGDTVVIAGKGHEDYQILGTQRVPFDDVEIARAAIELRMANGE